MRGGFVGSSSSSLERILVPVMTGVGLHDLKVRAAVEVITQPNLQPDNAG